MTEAVILVPGIMGSVLMDGDQVVWPGGPLELLLPYKHMTELLKPDLRATDVIRSLSISSQYNDLIDSLNDCGFTEDGSKPLKVFPYDWRKDNALAAAHLADCVDSMAATLGNDAEINLVAHSMGGLVSRCYLESGDYVNRPGFLFVKRLITLGTPHSGAPMALAAALGMEKRVFLNAAQVQQVANDPQYPSLYQLLPPQGEPFAWNRASDARLEPIDIYELSNAKKIGLQLANLTSAQQFHLKMSLARKPEHVRYFFFAGTQQQTTSSVQITFPATGNARVVKIIREDSGDGTVPTWSGSLSGVQMESVGGEHGELYKNGDLKRVLGALLGKSGVLLAAGVTPEISVLHKVVEPGDSTRVTIDFPIDTVAFDGELRVRKRVNAAGIKLENVMIAMSIPLKYSGAPIDHLAVLIVAPDFPGVYELELVPTGSGEPIASTELFVQEV